MSQEPDLSPLKLRSGLIRKQLKLKHWSPQKQLFGLLSPPPPLSPVSPLAFPLVPLSTSFDSFSFSDMSVTTTDSIISKIPFPQNESDFPLWKSQISSALSAQGIQDCITTARPAALAAFAVPRPVMTALPSTATATETQAAKTNYIQEYQFYKAALEDHNAEAANIKRWDRAFSFILSNLGRSQLILVRSVTAGDAQALWTALENTYGAVRNVNTLSSLYSSLSTITKLDSQSMKDYIGQIQSMVLDLEAQGENLSDARKKQFFLDGLSRSHHYRNVAATLSLTDTATTISLTNLLATLISEEKKRQSLSLAKQSSSMHSNTQHKQHFNSHTQKQFRPSSSSSNHKHTPSSASSHFHKKPKRPCYVCKDPNHNTTTCPSNPDKDMMCDKCGRKGHKTSNCKSRKYFGSQSRSSSSSYSASSSPASSSAASARSSNAPLSYFNYEKAFSVSTFTNRCFIVDTGATRHFCCDKSIMYDLCSESGSVSGAQNISCQFTQVGKINFVINGISIILNNVAYVPDFSVNLLSIRCFTDKGASINFLQSEGVMTLSPTLSFSFPRVGDLYVLFPDSFLSLSSSVRSSSAVSPSSQLLSSSSDSKEESIDLNSDLIKRITELHNLFGHLSYHKLFKLLTSGAINDSPFSNSELLSLKPLLPSLTKQECIGCLKGKMHRDSLTGVIDHQTKSIMDLWVVDDVGPFPFPSINDELYVLQIMDVHSHFPWSIMTKTKGEQTDEIINLIKNCQTITGLPLKRLHGDKAKQWAESSRLASFLSDNGTTLSLPSIHSTTQWTY